MSLLSEVIQEAEQGSDLWDKVRLGKFTSSEIERLISKNGKKLTEKANKYVLERVAEILTGQPHKEEFESNAMIWGIQKEPEARAAYEKATGLEVETCGFILHNEFYGGSPDGKVSPNGIIEIKCPNTATHIGHCSLTSQEDFCAEYPKYFFQMQSNMNVTGATWGHFISYDPRLKECPLFILHVKRDDMVIEDINKSVELGTIKIKQILAKLRGE